MLDALRQDVAHAARLLQKSPAFAATAVLTLALGTGVNVAVFSAVNAFVLRPLPVREGDRLAVVATRKAPSGNLGPVSWPDLQDYRRASTGVFEDVAGYSAGFLGLAPEGESAQRVLVTWVTGNYFGSLGLRPALGRLILDEEAQPGRVDPVAVLGYSTWQRRFHADPEVVGRSTRVNGRPVTIVGVAPRGFAGTFAFSESELFLPLTWTGGSALEQRDARFLHAVGRLRPGVGIAEAQAALDVVAVRLQGEHPRTNEGVTLRVLPERLARPEEDNARTNAFGAAIMLVLVGFVLAVAAVNVSGLLLARASERRREMATRAALGAGRNRLLRQLLTESLVLAVLGGGAGILLGAVAARLLARMRLPGDLPVRFDFDLDWRVLAFVAAVVLVTAAVVGAMPALRASRVGLAGMLRDAGRGQAGSGSRARFVMVATQIALCFVLLAAAGLFVRSLTRAERASLGFRPQNVLNAALDLDQLGYTEAQGRAFAAAIDQRLRAVPGVLDVAYAFSTPLGYVSTGSVVEIDEPALPDEPRPFAGMNMVSPRYFSTLGIPIVRGHAFTAADDERAPRVAIVNARLADQLWPGRDPLGRRIRAAGAAGAWLTVVGVTPTGKYGALFEEPRPYLYVPLAQVYTGLQVLHVRTAVAPEALARTVERIVHQREPQLVLYDIQSMASALGGGRGLFPVRMSATFAALFGALALALAVVGIYGLASSAAKQRRREIGVRVALGARPSDIRRLVLRDGLALVGAGLAVGVLVALGSLRLLAGLLYDVSASDPLTFAGVGPILAAVALIAYAIPAFRAARVDPTVALRDE